MRLRRAGGRGRRGGGSENFLHSSSSILARLHIKMTMRKGHLCTPVSGRAPRRRSSRRGPRLKSPSRGADLERMRRRTRTGRSRRHETARPASSRLANDSAGHCRRLASGTDGAAPAAPRGPPSQASSAEWDATLWQRPCQVHPIRLVITFNTLDGRHELSRPSRRREAP